MTLPWVNLGASEVQLFWVLQLIAENLSFSAVGIARVKNLDKFAGMGDGGMLKEMIVFRCFFVPGFTRLGWYFHIASRCAFRLEKFACIEFLQCQELAN